MRNLKIALGDLNHNTIGRHSVLMPLGIAFIASYTLQSLTKHSIDIRLYDNPDNILKDIYDWKPDVVALSNYCWNSELSYTVFKLAKNIKKDIVCISGGPQFPNDELERKEYLLERKETDFYIYTEGEIPFSLLIQKLQNNIELDKLKSEKQMGVISIHPKTENLVIGERNQRLKNLDFIPSPYLSNLLDSWFNGYYVPAIETARGCPFTCGFCFGGQQYFNNMLFFSIQRVKNELTYIAEKMKNFPSIMLSIHDSNFGMTKRDEEIAEHIRKLQDKFNWPNAFDVTTGKNNYDRILKIASILKNKMQVTCSVQSLNPKTLDVIKRKNIPLPKYKQIQSEIKKRGMLSIAEYIIPMPHETKTSFLKGVKTIVNSGVEKIVPYTSMMLYSTYLSSKECRNKYDLKTKYRILPRQFGEYMGKKCFEIEEVCIATNTMSFDEYLECRGFALISSIFSSEQFDIIHKHLKELKINNFDFLYYLWNIIKSNKTTLSSIYYHYIDETKSELWDSKEELFKFYSKEENYQKLLSGELGDNLIRKYKTKIYIEESISSLKLAYDTILNLSKDKLTPNIKESLYSSEKWCTSLRNIGNNIHNDQFSYPSRKKLNVNYDIYTWYKQKDDAFPLINFKKETQYVIYPDKHLKSILEESKKIYGDDIYFRLGKLLINWNICDFWLKCNESEVKK